MSRTEDKPSTLEDKIEFILLKLLLLYKQDKRVDTKPFVDEIMAMLTPQTLYGGGVDEGLALLPIVTPESPKDKRETIYHCVMSSLALTKTSLSKEVLCDEITNKIVLVTDHIGEVNKMVPIEARYEKEHPNDKRPQGPSMEEETIAWLERVLSWANHRQSNGF